MTEPEPVCGDTTDAGGDVVTCDLPAGHEGVHEGGNRTYWRPLVPTEPVTVDYDDLYRKALTTAGSTFGPKDPDELAAQILTRTELSRDELAHIMTRALLAVVEPDRVANLDDLRDELAEAMNDVAHENCGEDGQPCTDEDYGKYVDDVLMPVLRGHAVTPGSPGEAPHLNQPMVKRLRACAADTSTNWEGAVTIYPPEARGLVALIDQVLGTSAEVGA